MEIRELCDFVIKHNETGGYVAWGTEAGASSPSWVLTDKDSWAHPMTYADAESRLEDFVKRFSGTFKILSRQKSAVTLTKA